MRTVRINDENIVTVLSAGSWLLLIFLAVTGWLLVSGKFATGVLVGGLLAIANFYWLGSILKRALGQTAGNAERFARVRYVLRLAIIGLIVWIMIVHFKLDLLGLLLGLSVLVINIFALTIFRLTCKGG